MRMMPAAGPEKEPGRFENSLRDSYDESDSCTGKRGIGEKAPVKAVHRKPESPAEVLLKEFPTRNVSEVHNSEV